MQVTIQAVLAPLAIWIPMGLWLLGLVPSSLANSYPQGMARLNIAAAWLSLAGALVVAVLYAFNGVASWTFFSVDLPVGPGAFSISTYINSVTVIMLLLVSFVAVIVSRYAQHYLDGDPNRGHFHKWFSLTLASILTLIIAGNLLMFALAWIATSLCLHKLLVFYGDRPAAVLSAHKKFVASRLGDACLLTAVFLIDASLGTLQFDTLFDRMANYQGTLPIELEWAALLIVTAAALKSAQFPFHGWLIQVMEAPTPVSALLHAGIVNAGAFLIIRMSPVVSYSPIALDWLAWVGVVTLAVASLVMLTQTSVKVSLAWSTTAQMGFMLLECGLGLYSLAMLHLVAHSLYKAHAFLASGSVVDGFRGPQVHFSASAPARWQLLLIVMTSLLVTGLVAWWFGIHAMAEPALLAVSTVVAIATSRLLLQAASLKRTAVFLSSMVMLSLVVSTSYFTLHHVFDWLVAPSVVPVRETGKVFEWIMAGLVIAVFLMLFLLQYAFKHSRSAFLDALYVHLYNGFYIDVFLTRLLQRIWPAPANAQIFQGGK